MKNKLKLRTLACVIVTSCLLIQSCKKDDDCSPATIAAAGDDIMIIGTSTTLAGNVPTSGVGTWSIISGDGATLTDPLNATTTFAGVVGTTYVLQWAITGCPSSKDEVSITFSCDPAAAAKAGADQSIAGTTATLAANGTQGSGTWTIVSGAGGNITNAGSPTSTFTGTVGTTYTLRWTVACPASQDDVQISFNDGTPKITSIDKTSVLNGEIITITGVNFSANINGMSQINISKTSDPYANQEVFLPIISRTATEIKAVFEGTNGGASGTYAVRYIKKPDANAAVLYPANINITIAVPTANQFFTSSTFTNTNVAKGAEVSFGAKNGSLTAAEYSIKLVKYDYATGLSTESETTVTSVTANGYGSTMDKIAFNIPANLASGSYTVKVTYGEKTVVAGWGVFLNVN